MLVVFGAIMFMQYKVPSQRVNRLKTFQWVWNIITIILL